MAKRKSVSPASSAKHKPVGDIWRQDLAGCLPEMDWPGNFETLKERLYLVLALYRTRAISSSILGQIEDEAEYLWVKYHEYVINEMQYEIRCRASANNVDVLKEAMINEEWAARLGKRYPQKEVDEFMETLVSNRLKRDRA